jgi:hypothetical protein
MRQQRDALGNEAWPIGGCRRPRNIKHTHCVMPCIPDVVGASHSRAICRCGEQDRV